MTRALFVFLDGVGLGPASEHNPFHTLDLPALRRLAGGQNWTAEVEPIREPEHVFVPLRESSIGRDANADGDLFDWVLHLYDLAAETTVNVGLAGASKLDPKSRELFQAFEANQGQDMNGDGVLDAAIWHAIGTDGSATNLGVGQRIPMSIPLKGLPHADELDPSFLPFLVEEITSDLNGDGDQDDRVLQHWLHRSSTLENQAVAATSIIDGGVAANGERVTFVEIAEIKKDLNGDGDKFDSVLAVSRGPGHREIVPLALEQDVSTLAPAVRTQDLIAAFVVGESEQGADLNGDGDKQDELLHVLDGATGEVTPILWQVNVKSVAVVGNRVFAMRAESPANDWNGDGDSFDWVLFGYDLSTGQTTNYGLAYFNGVLGISAAGNALVVQVAEQAQGFTDLNGDGDASDTVVHVVRPDR